MRKSLSLLLLLPISIFILSCAGYAESAQGPEDNMSYQEYLVKEAELPQLPLRPNVRDSSSRNDETLAQYNAWWEAKAEQQGIVIPDIEVLQDFVRNTTRQIIAGREAENFLFSPVGLWLCLHTLSDLTVGDSREQILDVIGHLENSDEQLDTVFRSLYWEDGGSVCVPAISVWLNQGTNVSGGLLDRLATEYASVFQGSMGDLRFNQALQLWLNEQTRGLLKESVSDLRFSPDTGLLVCSTLYLKNGWSMPFNREATAPDVFYTETGEVTTDFMHSSNTGVVFHGDKFSAVFLDFSNGGSVAFILPDAGVGPEELLKMDDVFHFLFSGRDWDDSLYGKVNLSVPKIDCLSKIPLRSSLERMGITDIFNSEKAQFSAEISSDSELAVSALQQYARLIMNEDGVEAAAVTFSPVGSLPRSMEDNIDFTLNRPFLYAVMSEKSIPLFIGMYYTP